MNNVKTSELFSYRPSFLRELFDTSVYPWEILPKIKDFIFECVKEGIDGFTEYTDSVLVGKNVTIHGSAVIEGPAIIGANTVLRPGAYLRENVIIGSGCVIGNSCELKNCILLDGSQVPHYNYVGDSILGNRSHLGAGSICSNLKADGRQVVIHGDADIETNLRKVGAFLGDGSDVGCGCVLNPGTVIGKNTSVYPLVAVRGIIGEGYIVKSMNEICKRY